MRIVRAFQSVDGQMHLTPEAAAQHDFVHEMQKIFKEPPTIGEMSVNMDQIQRIIEKVKSVDSSYQVATK